MNRSMDDLLRDTLRARAADSTAACVDAETAAAFVDGALSARARSSVEAHIADCPRCQAVLAALVRSTPPRTSRAWWRRPAVAWFVPAAVAAGAVAIWISVPDQATVPTIEARRDVRLPIEAVPTQPQPPAATAELPASPPPGSLKDAQSGLDASRLRRSAAASSAAKTSPPPASPETSASRVEARKEEAAAAPRDARADAAASPRVGGAANVEPARPAALAERMTILSAARATIVSSDRTTQWRIGAAGEVQHSADGGSSWQTQATGVGLTPSAGSSPSSSVCWLVGRAGLVLLTTDGGQSWRRLSFPLVTDLASIRATDNRTATIVSVDGRTFTTSDAGRSWQ